MTEHPTVVQGFIDVYESWIDLGIDGFRIDTVKHVNFEFWQQWTTAVLDYAHAAGKPDFFMFGEVYDFARVDRDQKVGHLVALNNAAEPATVTVTTLTPGATFTSLYGDHAPVTAGADGTVTLTVPGLS